MQSSLFSNKPALTVTEITRAIRLFLENETTFQDQWVEGEISNLSQPSSGHLYFTIKDAMASLRCVAWRPNAGRIKKFLKNGAAVEVFGSIGVYEKGGSYQFYVEDVKPVGEGYLYQEFIRLKNLLESEGLFDSRYKKSLPEYPKVIGVVTSQSAAAYQDILNTIKNRNQMVEVILAPASVQGDEAPPQLIKSVLALNAIDNLDLIIIARGGGSLEDLWAFNNEILVRVISEIDKPIISGVGHETDFTLVDFAADLRAPTPTGAAALAVPEITEYQKNIESLFTKIITVYNNNINDLSSRLHTIDHKLDQTSPKWKVHNNRQKIDELSYRSNTAIKNILNSKNLGLTAVKNQLYNLDPKSILNRGYALISDENDIWVQTVHNIKKGKPVNIRMADGHFKATPDQPEIDEK